MPDLHITKLLEEKPFASLSEADIARAESHVASCLPCRSAYDASRVAASLLQARTAETIDVGPFFKTRVMAALRDRRPSPEVTSFARMWRAASALVSAMAVLLVILAGFTIFTQSPASQVQMVSSHNLYSPEYVVLEDPGDGEVGNDQVIATIYDLEDGDGQ